MADPLDSLPRPDSPIEKIRQGLAAHAAVIEAAKQAGAEISQPAPPTNQEAQR